MAECKGLTRFVRMIHGRFLAQSKSHVMTSRLKACRSGGSRVAGEAFVNTVGSVDPCSTETYNSARIAVRLRSRSL